MTLRSKHQQRSSMGVLGFARLAMGLAPHEPHDKDGLLENCFLKSPTTLRLAEEIHRLLPYADAKRKPLHHPYPVPVPNQDQFVLAPSHRACQIVQQ